MGDSGGDGDFSYEDPKLDEKLDHDDDEEKQVDRTRPFQPVPTSTPYHGGETIEMQTRQHEKTGLHLAPKVLKRRRTPRPCWEEEK